MSHCSQTRDSSRFKICWGWRIQTTYSLRQFPESISSSVCECGVCVVSTHTCMYLPVPTHTEGLCAHSHMACRPLSLSPPYSWSYAGSQPQKFPCLSLPCSVLGFQAPAWPQWLFTWVMRSKVPHACEASALTLWVISLAPTYLLLKSFKEALLCSFKDGKEGNVLIISRLLNKANSSEMNYIITTSTFWLCKSQVKCIRRNQF